MIASRINKCRQNTFKCKFNFKQPNYAIYSRYQPNNGKYPHKPFNIPFGNGSLTFAKQKPETAKNITSPSKPPLAIKSVGYTPV